MFITVVASFLPTSSARFPVTTISSVASSFFVLSSCSPVAVSYAIWIPVSAPVPDTSNGQAATTSQFFTPDVESEVAIMLQVTQLRLAVLTLIPPDWVGFTYAQLTVLVPICSIGT